MTGIVERTLGTRAEAGVGVDLLKRKGLRMEGQKRLFTVKKRSMLKKERPQKGKER